jgi:hypothetical protein
MNEIISYKEVREKVLTIRGESVLLDRDVATLYGVGTKEVNQAVKNNPDKFPEGYIIVLGEKEKSELVKKFDRFETLKHSTALPSAFTEKGLYMLATILRSPKATNTTIAIVETFAKMRELSRALNQLSDTSEKDQQKEILQKAGELLADIFTDRGLEVTGDETTLEVNLAFMKLKHTTTRGKNKEKNNS